MNVTHIFLKHVEFYDILHYAETSLIICAKHYNVFNDRIETKFQKHLIFLQVALNPYTTKLNNLTFHPLEVEDNLAAKGLKVIQMFCVQWVAGYGLIKNIYFFACTLRISKIH